MSTAILLLGGTSKITPSTLLGHKLCLLVYLLGMLLGLLGLIVGLLPLQLVNRLLVALLLITMLLITLLLAPLLLVVLLLVSLLLIRMLLLLQLLLLLTVLVALPLEGADPIVKGNNVENDGALNPYGRPELLLPLLSDSEARE